MRAVLFDAVGTLLVPEPEAGLVYRDAGRAHGLALEADEIRRRFGRAFAAEEDRDRAAGGGRTSPEREHERWWRIVAEVFAEATVATAEAIFAALWEHFARPEHWRLVAGAQGVLSELAARGLTVGVASNFDERLHQVCAGHPPLDRCPWIFASSELGYRKPAREFFRAIEGRLGLSPGELMLVGDDLENDFEGARAAGWRAVLVDREPLLAPGEQVSDLAGLLLSRFIQEPSDHRARLSRYEFGTDGT